MNTENTIFSYDTVNALRNLPDNLRPRDAARYLGVSTSLLAKLRMREKRDCGPRFVKLSGCVIYRRSDLDAWLERNATEGSQ